MIAARTSATIVVSLDREAERLTPTHVENRRYDVARRIGALRTYLRQSKVVSR
jgi:hypothetical protein